MSDDRVTTGELYRLCQRIEEAVIKQNGRVTKLEQDSVRIKAYWSSGAVFFAIFGGWLRNKLGL